jgi:hypothetical protein
MSQWLLTILLVLNLFLCLLLILQLRRALRSHPVSESQLAGTLESGLSGMDPHIERIRAQTSPPSDGTEAVRDKSRALCDRGRQQEALLVLEHAIVTPPHALSLIQDYVELASQVVSTQRSDEQVAGFASLETFVRSRIVDSPLDAVDGIIALADGVARRREAIEASVSPPVTDFDDADPIWVDARDGTLKPPPNDAARRSTST